MINYIKNLFGTYKKRRTEQFRKRFERAYPDAAELINGIEAVDPGHSIYYLPCSIIASGSVSANATGAEVIARRKDGGWKLYPKR